MKIKDELIVGNDNNKDEYPLCDFCDWKFRVMKVTEGGRNICINCHIRIVNGEMERGNK